MVIHSTDLFYTSYSPLQNGKLIKVYKLAILNKFRYLQTNAVYRVRKILDLEITKSEIFFKKLPSASTKNGWGTYFEWIDIKKLIV